MYYKTDYNSPIGKLRLASDGQRLVGLWIEGQKYFEGTLSSEVICCGDLEIFDKTKNWLDSYFKGKNPDIGMIPLAPNGTEFRQEVWSELCKIPYGEVITYGELADRIAKNRGVSKMSARAVGGAVGHNPVSIIIPCHRVIGSNGALTGYAGGVDVKLKLLELEGAVINF